MLQDIISYINTLDPALIYLVLFFFAFIENIFPPSPSDVVLVIGSTLIAKTTIGFVPILLLTSTASAIGFVCMYYVGKYFGDRVLRSGKLKFIKQETLDKTDKWFGKYGYNLILINRFLPGTRAVISFFTGVHKLAPMKTFFYAAFSSFIWNGILIFVGYLLGNNIDQIDACLSAYSNIVLVLIVIIVAVLLVKHFRKKKKSE